MSLARIKENQEKREKKQKRIKEPKENKKAPPSRASAREEAGDDYSTLLAFLKSEYPRWARENANCLAHLSREDVATAAWRMKYTCQDASEWLEYMDAVGWCFDDGRSVDMKNYRHSMRGFMRRNTFIKAKRAQEARFVEREAKRAERKARYGAPPQKDYLEEREKEAKGRRETAKRNEGWWILCAEQCEQYAGNCVCKAGCPVPPAHWEYPRPPKECKHAIIKPEDGE